jgi:hypothetical protein
MTTTDERIDSLVWAENLMSDMLDSPHVDEVWKEQIRMVLRHYPWPLYIRNLREDPPSLW